jgi:hypothetical protein
MQTLEKIVDWAQSRSGGPVDDSTLEEILALNVRTIIKRSDKGLASQTTSSSLLADR